MNTTTDKHSESTKKTIVDNINALDTQMVTTKSNIKTNIEIQSRKTTVSYTETSETTSAPIAAETMIAGASATRSAAILSSVVSTDIVAAVSPILSTTGSYTVALPAMRSSTTVPMLDSAAIATEHSCRNT